MAANNVKGKKVIRRRREKKNVEKGQVHIRYSFNNTMFPRQQEVHSLRRPERS